MAKLENIHVDNLNDSGRHAALGWDCDGARFHVWFDPSDWTIQDSRSSGSMRSFPTVYKNPPCGVKYKEAGHFTTRRLDASKGPNAKMLADAKAYAIAHDLIGKAIQANADAKAQNITEQHERRMIDLCKEAGPKLLQALRDIQDVYSHSTGQRLPIIAEIDEIVQAAIALATTVNGS